MQRLGGQQLARRAIHLWRRPFPPRNGSAAQIRFYSVSTDRTVESTAKKRYPPPTIPRAVRTSDDYIKVKRRGFGRHRKRPLPVLRAAISDHLYQVSNTLLDLDAEGSPYVRTYDKDDYLDLKHHWGRELRLAGTLRRMEMFKKELRKAEEMWQGQLPPFDQRRISARDIWDVVLLGTEQKVGRRLETKLQALTKDNYKLWGASRKTVELLRSNGIQDIVLDNPHQTLNFMLSWQGRHIPAHQYKWHQIPKLAEVLKKDTHQNTPLHVVRRSLSELFRNDRGPAFIRLAGSLIAKALCPGGQVPEGKDAVETLIFVNNLAVNMRARKTQLSLRMRELGLRLACQTGNVSAIPMYLEGKAPLGAEAIQESLMGLLDSLHAGKIDAEQRVELFGYMTGRSFYDTTKELCICGKMDDRPAFSAAYGHYVVLLGELGAVRTLWHEWHGPLDGLARPPLADRGAVFADALARYSALRRCQSPPIPSAIKAVDGDEGENALLDVRDLAGFGALPSNMRYAKIPGAAYTAKGNEGGNSMELDFRSYCEEALTERDVGKAMAALGELLLPQPEDGAEDEMEQYDDLMS